MPEAPTPEAPMTEKLPVDRILSAAAKIAASRAELTDDAISVASLQEMIRQFGDLGAFALDLDGSKLADAAALVRVTASESMSTSFSLWAHRMVIEYLRTSSGERGKEYLAELVSGQRLGSIAMATALQELAGLGAVPTRAVPDGAGGFTVHGRIAWASNIAPGTLVFFPARVAAADAPEDEDSGERVLLTALVGSPGLITQPAQNLLALNATQSASLRFDGLHVPAQDVFATSLEPARARRTPHFLLQSAMCLGLADRCLQIAAQFGAAEGVLSDFQHRLLARIQALTATLNAQLETPADAARVDVTRVRYESARLASAAARHESMHAGGRGFVTTSATNRRLREAAFLPVQSPSEVQLLSELTTLGVDPTSGYQI